MSRFLPYSPDQTYLLPPSVKEVLPAGHLCFFLQQMVAKLDLEPFEQEYSDEGGQLYDPALMLSVWLYAYATGITSGRELERQIRQDLALRYLSGGAQPDHWALSAFRRRHQRALNDVFVQVLEFVRDQGLGKLGTVAVDGSPIAASNSKGRVDSVARLRRQRARYRQQVREWQKRCNAEDNPVAEEYAQEQMEKAQKRLETIPGRLQKLKKSGRERLPQTDPDASVLKKRGKSVVGYQGQIAVSEDQFIVGQQVSQAVTENASLLPMVEQVESNCGEKPQKVLGDSGLYSNANAEALKKEGIDAYIPDSNLAAVLNRGGRVKGRARAAVMKEMRAKFRTTEGRRLYAQRRAIVEGPFGTLKVTRHMAQFRLRGLDRVGIEFTLGVLAYNLTRLHQELNPNSALWQRRRARDKKKQQEKQRRTCRTKKAIY
jgi:transposase